MIVLIFGLPGSGKTTLARAFATKSGALQLSTDILRREMSLMGHYGMDDKQKVYHLLLEKAKTALLQGRQVVIDSTFYKESIRESFRQLALETGVPLRWVEVRAQEFSIKQRLQHPRPDSEADFAAYEKIRDEADPFTEQRLVLWSDITPLDKMVDSVQQYVTT